VVLIANRTDRKARNLAREFGLDYVRMSEIDPSRFDILANATSVGMVPHVNVSPVPKEMLRGKVVFEAVYNPRMTKLLRDAEAVGARTVSGIEMYLNQAARQFRLYIGHTPDVHRMRMILDEYL
jgi:3-dehydroquinate dehydratase/shikimate dehydrogenase